MDIFELGLRAAVVINNPDQAFDALTDEQYPSPVIIYYWTEIR